MTDPAPSIAQRLAERAAAWRVRIEDTLETPGSVIAYGTRDGEPVVLKLVRMAGDEWNAGAVLHAFDGRGMVRALATHPGAMLLERLQPGRSLAELATTGRDVEATDVLARVLEAMPLDASAAACPAVADWGFAFARHAADAHRVVPTELLDQARETWDGLVRSQGRPLLLHGDLQHSNVLLDARRGWVAIDPKGVVGEREFEIGAILRNPVDRPALFTRPAVIERRVAHLAARLRLDRDRILGWAFAQAVLSAIWMIEDGSTDPLDWAAPLRLARVLAPMVR